MYDQIIFGLTAAVSFVTAAILAWLFAKSRAIPKLLCSLSFFILGLSTALISYYGLSVLSQPLIAPVDSLIPGLLGAGLLMYSRENWGFYFLMYVILVFCALFALSFDFGALTAQYVMLVHFPGGLIIFILPDLHGGYKETCNDQSSGRSRRIAHWHWRARSRLNLNECPHSSG